MKLTLTISVDEALDTRVRAEAARQRRPLSWVVAEALDAGLDHMAARAAVPATTRRGRAP